MGAETTAIEVPDGYRGIVHRPPIAPPTRRALAELLGHKGKLWHDDIRARLAGDGLDLFAAAYEGDVPVAHAWLGSRANCPESAILGHVYTVEEHRRRGLARSLLAALLREFDQRGGRWVQLGTGSESAVRLYRQFDFRTINRHGQTRTMLRGGEGEGRGVGPSYLEASGAWTVEPLSRDHHVGLAILFNVTPEPGKMPLLGVDRGVLVEEYLLGAVVAHERGECSCSVLVDETTGRVHGVACRKGRELQIYAPQHEDVMREMLAQEAADDAV